MDILHIKLKKGFVNIRKFILFQITKDNFKEIDSKLLIRLMEVLVFKQIILNIYGLLMKTKKSIGKSESLSSFGY